MGRDAVHGRALQPGGGRRAGIHLALTLALASLAAPRADAHDPPNSTVSWTREIAPLVQARCAGCHVEGGRGPMPLTSYETARPWAKAIREEVLTRRMPKWHAARGYGQFANDRSLTPFEIGLIVAWVDGGARRNPPASTSLTVPGPEPRPSGPEPRAPSPEPRTRPEPRAPNSVVTTSREVTMRCGDRAMPHGRLVALRPELREGGSAGISVVFPDGRREVLAWIRGFERAFTETYWLRSPIDLPSGARLRVEADGGCRVILLLR